MGRVNHETHSDHHIKPLRKLRFEHVMIVKHVDITYSISKALIVDVEPITCHRKIRTS